jgi:multidrug efflux system membrane fusion protein
VLWIGSGLIFPHEKHIENEVQGKMEKIKIENFSAVKKATYIEQPAVTEAKTFALIKTEIEGRVVELLADDGAYLKKGDPVIRLDERDHKTNLNKAEANLSQKQINYKAAEAVFQKGLSSKNAFAEAESQLRTAESSLLQAQIALQNTIIRAPFDGVVDHITSNIGDFLRAGENVTTLLAIDPMIAVAYIPERDVALVDKTQETIAQRQGGQGVSGKITFLSNISDQTTRSFRLEATIPNQDGSILSGETLNLKIPSGFRNLHKIPNIALTLDLPGELKVKTITPEKIVKSYLVEIVEEDPDGVWVSGLPESVDIILMGQSFVSDGESLNSEK